MTVVLGFMECFINLRQGGKDHICTNAQYTSGNAIIFLYFFFKEKTVFNKLNLLPFDSL